MSEILFITRNFPPLVGGMERLALESLKALADEWAVDLIGPRGCEQWVDSPVEAVGVAHDRVIGFLVSGALRVLRRAPCQDRVAVIGGSGLAAPLVIAAARRSSARSCCFVHGLDLVVAHPAYRTFFLPAIRKMDLVVANSRNTAALARHAGVDAARIRIIHPGVSLNVDEPASRFFSRYPETRGRKLLLSVGRLLPRKGVSDFVRSVLPQVVRKHPETLLVVAGGQAHDALLRSDDELCRLKQAINEHNLTDHVLITGFLESKCLASLYAAACALVFPVRDLPGDVEGFGMVALEAAAQGLPTVAFDTGGVQDAVRDGVSGTLVPAGEHARMIEAVSDYLSGNAGAVTAASCRRFAQQFGWDNYGERLRGLIRQLVDGPANANS